MAKKPQKPGRKGEKVDPIEVAVRAAQSLPDDLEKMALATPPQQSGAVDRAATGYLGVAIGQSLKRWRDRAGMTLQQVENQLGPAIKAPYLSQVERGKLPTPRLDTIYQLGATYGVPVWELINELAAVLGQLSVLDTNQKRNEEVDRAFEYVRSMPDFPTREKDYPIDANVLSVVPPQVKLAMVLLYERASGLRVLPRSVSQEGPASGSGIEREVGSDDD